MASVLSLVEANNPKILQLTVAVPGSVSLKELKHALLFAANKGITECASILITTANVNPNTANSLGTTCLMQAAENGHADVVEMLIKCGVDLNAQNVSGATALHYSAHYGHNRCSEILINAGANINIQDKAGNTPLIAAAKNARYTINTMGRLADHDKSKLNIQNAVGRTALHYVVNQADLISWCGILLACGADPNIQDNEGNTPFMLAATEGFDEVLKCLIAFHCDPDTCNNYGKAPIHFLAQKNHYEVIDFMTELDCNFDQIDKAGNTPLHYAVFHNRPEAVKSLLRANCKLEAGHSEGKAPLAIALEKKLWGIGKLLVLAGCEVLPLYPWLVGVEAEARERQRERLTLFEEQLQEEVEDEDLTEAVQWFSEWLHKPHSLQQLSRISIRLYVGGRLLGKGQKLPIPPALQDYITLKEVEDHHIEGFLM